MKAVIAFLRRLFHVLATPVRLVREGQSDLDGTYPGRARPSAQEQVTQGMVTSSFVNPGGAGIF